MPIGKPVSVNPHGIFKVGHDVMVMAKVIENQSTYVSHLCPCISVTKGVSTENGSTDVLGHIKKSCFLKISLC